MKTLLLAALSAAFSLCAGAQTQVSGLGAQTTVVNNWPSSQIFSGGVAAGLPTTSSFGRPFVTYDMNDALAMYLRNGDGAQVLAKPINGNSIQFGGPNSSSLTLAPNGTTQVTVNNNHGVSTTMLSGTGTATFAAGAAAGSGPGTPTCTTSHVCDSVSGTISFTMGTSTTTGVALTVTTTVTRTNQSNCVGAMYLAASPYTAIPIRMTETTTTLVFNAGTAPTASQAYELTYACGGI